MASWGSLGHITVAEPGALLGFLGPARLRGPLRHPVSGERAGGREPLRQGAHRRRGAALAAVRRRRPRPEHSGHRPAPARRPAAHPRREAVRRRGLGFDRNLTGIRAARTCASCWPTAPATSLPLNGTGQGEKDPGLLLALARFGQKSCVVIGHTRPRPVAADGDGTGVAPRGAPGHAAGRGARAAAADGHRHRRSGPVQGSGGRRAGRRDRQVPARSDRPQLAHRLRAAGAGSRRRCTGPAAGRPDHRGPARLALAAAAGRRQRHRAPEHRLCACHVRSAGRQRGVALRPRNGRAHRGRTPRCRPGG